MKKVFALFMAVFLCLAIFNSVFRISDRSYKDTVSAAVDIINGVGGVSHTVLSYFDFSLVDIDGLPNAYRLDYRYMYNKLEREGHSLDCLNALEYYFRNLYYTDCKIYYLQSEGALFNDSFEQTVLNWSLPSFKRAQPDLAYEAYLEGLELGYPMDNSFLHYYDSNYEFSCVCGLGK